MLLLNLLKKDVLIVKKYVGIMLAAAVLIPPFMLWKAPEYTGTFGFVLSTVFCVFMLLQYVSLKEYQFPKAVILLCSAPFSRKMIVLSKYIFCIAVYVVCCAIYAAETILMPALGTGNGTIFFLMLIVVSAGIGVYLPAQYRIGYEKTRFALGVGIMVSPFLLPQLMKIENMNLSRLSGTCSLLICVGALVLSLIILIVSVRCSIKFYSEMDLA